jgi:hypothetical protein
MPVRLEGVPQYVGRGCECCSSESVPANYRLVEMTTEKVFDAVHGIIERETVVREKFVGPVCAIPVRGLVLNQQAIEAFNYHP